MAAEDDEYEGKERTRSWQVLPSAACMVTLCVSCEVSVTVKLEDRDDERSTRITSV